MKFTKSLFLSLWLATAAGAFAQMYSPDTQYHDVVQRIFPVEAARVLLSQYPTAAQCEVTFSASGTPDGHFQYTLGWKVSGKEIAKCDLNYEEADLLKGPDFYREMFTKIAAAMPRPAKTLAPEPTSSELLSEAYWRGAESAHSVRFETMLVAERFRQAHVGLKHPAEQAELAGILTHGALPGLCQQTQLDALWLARGAAWACWAEKLAGSKLEPNAWVPTLLLAGRWPAATEMWKSIKDAASPIQHGWQILAKDNLGARQMLMRLAERDVGLMALPVAAWTWDGSPGSAEFTDDHLPLLLPKSPEQTNLVDYLPQLIIKARMGVNREHLSSPSEHLANYSKTIQTLGKEWLSQGLDESQVTSILTIARSMELIMKEHAEISDWLAQATPLFKLGSEGLTGKPLLPITATSPADFLHYGWESTGLHVAAGLSWLRTSIGDYDAARSFAKLWKSHLPGAGAFLARDDEKSTTPIPLKDWSSLDLLDNGLAFYYAMRKAPADSKRLGQDGLRSVARRWLSPEVARIAVHEMCASKTPEHTQRALVIRALKEGGRPLASAFFIGYTEPFKHLMGLPDVLAARAPYTKKGPGFATLYREYTAKHDTHGMAIEFEKMAYEEESSTRMHDSFRAYVWAGDFASAKRVLFESEVIPCGSIDFSNTIMEEAWLLGWLTKDKALMDYAMEQGSCYSTSDLYARILAALANRDYKQAEKLLDACIERYETSPLRTALKSFFPLFPALKDPAHADHEKALDHFSKIDIHPHYQWFILKAADLSPDDAARFLNASTWNKNSPCLVAALKNDKEAFLKAYQETMTTRSQGNILLTCWLAQTQFGVEAPKPAASQKPKDFVVWQEKITRLGKARQEKSFEMELKLNAATTADEAWEKLSSLRDRNRLNAALKAARSKDEATSARDQWWRGQMAAAKFFLAHYPKDPRAMQAEAVAVVAQDSLSEGDPVKLNPEWMKLLQSAEDVPSELKAAVAFALLGQHLSAHRDDEDQRPFLAEVEDFAKQFPQSPEAVRALLWAVGTYAEDPSAQGLAGLKRLAEASQKEIVSAATQALEKRAFQEKLHQEPLNLTFEATDHGKVDAGKLRGKVVVLDFWASWCGPCMAELPDVCELYEKQHPNGLEILGINLDDDPASVATVQKKFKMPWPQHCDGKGWETPLAQRFDVHSIPSVWIFDKKGMLRFKDLRGKELAEAVAKLLEE